MRTNQRYYSINKMPCLQTDAVENVSGNVTVCREEGVGAMLLRTEWHNVHRDVKWWCFSPPTVRKSTLCGNRTKAYLTKKKLQL